MKYPALDVDGVDSDLLLALLDDFGPTAVDIHGSVVTVFFHDAARRDAARHVVVRTHAQSNVQPRDIDDEDWARRSQENLTAITVGRITVSPPWSAPAQAPSPESRIPSPLTIVIAPSMGFGTGHHATTRLCLQALQELNPREAHVVDVGTGSGVLAIAARMLGAADALGIDDDPDAIHAAMENVARNPGADRVRFEVKDLRSAPLPKADVITANLTGALLMRSANLLLAAVNPGGSLIVSGLQRHERDDVVRAFGSARNTWEAAEDEWVGIVFKSG
ncbi:MAG TPA: 50S ribosomal protein L11 methyltransferase [Vicinamibacterales bacterium]